MTEERLPEEALDVPLPRGRHKLSREFVIRSQRQRMLRAVAEEVAANGYAATSVARVIARAGVSRKTFYEHFDDKEACFLAAYDDGVKLLFERVEQAYQSADVWPERMRAGLRALLELFAEEPALAQMCTVEVLAAGPRALDRYRHAVSGFFPFFGEGELGPGKPVPPVVGEAVVLGVNGVLYRRILAGEIAKLPELLPELLYFVLAPYVGPDEAAAIADRRPPTS